MVRGGHVPWVDPHDEAAVRAAYDHANTVAELGSLYHYRWSDDPDDPEYTQYYCLEERIDHYDGTTVKKDRLCDLPSGKRLRDITKARMHRRNAKHRDSPLSVPEDDIRRGRLPITAAERAAREAELAELAEGPPVLIADIDTYGLPQNKNVVARVERLPKRAAARAAATSFHALAADHARQLGLVAAVAAHYVKCAVEDLQLDGELQAAEMGEDLYHDLMRALLCDPFGFAIVVAPTPYAPTGHPACKAANYNAVPLALNGDANLANELNAASFAAALRVHHATSWHLWPFRVPHSGDLSAKEHAVATAVEGIVAEFAADHAGLVDELHVLQLALAFGLQPGWPSPPKRRLRNVKSDATLERRAVFGLATAALDLVEGAQPAWAQLDTLFCGSHPTIKTYIPDGAASRDLDVPELFANLVFQVFDLGRMPIPAYDAPSLVAGVPLKTAPDLDGDDEALEYLIESSARFEMPDQLLDFLPQEAQGIIRALKLDYAGFRRQTVICALALAPAAAMKYHREMQKVKSVKTETGQKPVEEEADKGGSDDNSSELSALQASSSSSSSDSEEAEPVVARPTRPKSRRIAGKPPS